MIGETMRLTDLVAQALKDRSPDGDPLRRHERLWVLVARRNGHRRVSAATVAVRAPSDSWRCVELEPASGTLSRLEWLLE